MLLHEHELINNIVVLGYFWFSLVFRQSYCVLNLAKISFTPIVTFKNKTLKQTELDYSSRRSISTFNLHHFRLCRPLFLHFNFICFWAAFFSLALSSVLSLPLVKWNEIDNFFSKIDLMSREKKQPVINKLELPKQTSRISAIFSRDNIISTPN